MWCVLVTSDACCLLLTEEIASKKIQRPIDSVLPFGQNALPFLEFFSLKASKKYRQVFLYEQRAAYRCNHFWFAICISGTILGTVALLLPPHWSDKRTGWGKTNPTGEEFKSQDPAGLQQVWSWELGVSEILRVNMNEIMNLILDSLLQEHGVESHSSINKQIRTCRFAGLHGDASTPYVACEATTTAADPVRRTT